MSVNLTSEVFTRLNSVLSEQGAYLNSAPFTAAYPSVVFSLPSQSTVNKQLASIGHETESFPIQISIFDDQDGERIFETQTAIEDAMRNGNWGSYKAKIQKQGTIGPYEVEDGNSKYWQLVLTYEITLEKQIY